MRTVVVFRNRALIGFCWLAVGASVIGFGSLAIIGAGPHPGPSDHAIAALLGLGFAAVFLRGTRMRVEVDDAAITVCNSISTRRVPGNEFAGASANYYGLRIARTQGGSVVAGSLGKPNRAVWLRRRCLADEVVDQLNAMGDQHRGSA